MNRTIAKITVVWLLVSVSLPVSAASAWEQAFDEGNELYAKAQYAESFEKYAQALDYGYVSWELFFNMGNACYRTGDYPKAILYYEKAAKLNPKQADIQHNLQLAELKIADRFEELPDFFLSAWWSRIVRLFSLTGWATGILIFVLLVLASLALYLLGISYGQKRGGFYGLIVCLFLLIVSICAGIDAYRRDNTEFAVIMQSSVAAKTSPEERSETKFMLHEGSKVCLEDYIAPYYRVRIRNGERGWVLADSFEKI